MSSQRRRELRGKIIEHTIASATATDELSGKTHRTLASAARGELIRTYPAGRFCRGCGLITAMGHKPGCEVAR